MKIKEIVSVISTVLLAGCSVAEMPEHLEPLVTVLPAEDVTRESALLRSVVERRGEEGVEFLRFAYTPAEGEEQLTGRVEVVTDKASYRLTGLDPGVEYRYRAIGYVGGIEIQSDESTFKTIAADKPLLGECPVLSQGPTTLLLSITVLDDGGSPLTAIGCRISDSFTEEDITSDPEENTLLITGLTPGQTYTITPFASNPVGSSFGDTFEFTAGDAYVVTSPGQLGTLLAESGLPAYKLVVSGPLDGDDFREIRRLFDGNSDAVTLKALDISGASIVSGGGSYDGSRLTVDDTVTTGLLASLPALEEVRLPMNAEVLERDALAGCMNLRRLDVPASASSVVPSDGCKSLNEIGVEEGNGHYSSVDGVLYDKSVSRLVWFPAGLKGEYDMPPTVTEIGVNAFRGTGITTLRLPDSLTKIARGAFSGSGLEKIEMPGRLTNIAEGMFQGCASLREVSLGASTEFIGAYVFDGVPLERLTVAAAYPPVVTEETFRSTTSSTGDICSSCVLLVPAASLSLYRSHPLWSRFTLMEGGCEPTARKKELMEGRCEPTARE